MLKSIVGLLALLGLVSSLAAAPTNAPAVKKPVSPVASVKVGTNKVAAASVKPAAATAAAPTGSADDAAITAVMVKFENAVKVNDFTYAVDVMYAPMLEKMGGRSKVMVEAKTVQMQMKSDQIKFNSWTAFKPYTYLNGTVRRYAIIRFESVLTGAGKQFRLRSYLLGIRTGKGPWQFLNGDDLSTATYQQFFPDFPKNVQLPKPSVVPM